MNDIFNYHRRATVDVNVGGVMLGGKHSVKVQSMTNTNTDDIEASVAQCRRIADCGGDRVTECHHLGATSFASPPRA